LGYPQEGGGAAKATQLRAKNKHDVAPCVSGSELVSSLLGRGQVAGAVRMGRLRSETDARLSFDPENMLHFAVLIRGNHSSLCQHGKPVFSQTARSMKLFVL